MQNASLASLPQAVQSLVAPDFSLETAPQAATVEPVTKPFIVRAEEGQSFEMPGEKGILMVPSARTAGRVTAGILEATVNGGPPPHAHANEEEIFLIQSGAFEAFSNGQKIELRAGDMVYLARDEAHNFRGLDSGEANRFNIIIAPGGFENFYARWINVMKDGAPDPQEAMAVCADFGITLFPSFEAAPVVETSQSKVVRGAEVPVIDVLGDQMQILLTAAETGGRYTLVRIQGPADSGPPPHIHDNEDELFMIERGTIEFTIGDEKILAHEGDVVWGPRDYAHTFRRVTEGACMTVFMTPGGLDEFFVDCDELGKSGNINHEAVIELCARYGMSVIPPVN